VAFCDAGARCVDVAEALAVDAGDVFPVEEGEAVAVPVCDLDDVPDGV
jgi:hypothetical protein